jgi:photosystem II stability/assembly factor-like uncharacterized protein
MKKLIFSALIALTIFILKTNNTYAQWVDYFWYNQELGEYFINDVNFADPNTGWSAGIARSYTIPPTYWSIVLYTFDGGVTWTKPDIPLTKSMNSIQSLNSSILYVSGDSNTIIKSVNSGVSWQILSPPVISSSDYSWAMYFTDPNTGWISTTVTSSSPRTYSTTNGGASWNAISNAGFSKISFLNNTAGFGINGSGLYRTTNGGVSWNVQIPDSLITGFTFLNQSQSTGWCFSAHSLYSNTAKGKGWNTTDGGNNWNLMYSNDTVNSFTRVKFFDPVTGYANNFTGSPSRISKTSNGGQTWFNPTDLRYDFSNMFFVNPSDGWADGTYGIYAKTTAGPGNFINPYFANTVTYQNSNNINNRVSGKSFCYPLGSVQPGLEWPKGQNKYLIYMAGLCIGAQVKGGIKIAYSLYASSFDFGIIDNNGNAAGHELGSYGVYRIKTGDGPGVPDWDNWPVSQGAPTQNGQPLLYGDMTSFASITDGYPQWYVFSPPLKAEVKMLVYSFNSPSPYNDIIFIKYTIKNRSGVPWDSAFVSIFADPDVGNPNNNKMGSDKALNLSYAYNSNNYDTVYGNAPPAVGIKVLESPVNNTAFSAITFYNNFYNCLNDPLDSAQVYNYMKGLDQCGNPFIYQNNVQRFVFDGDPETGTGWIMPTSQDVRITITSGPFTLQNNESTTFTVAVIAARGNSNLNSVTKLKQISTVLPIGIHPVSQGVPGSFSLSQNYPNPFNPTTRIKFNIPGAVGNGRDRSVQLKIYDILGRVVSVLVDGKLAAGSYEADWNALNYPSGVYFYRLETNGFAETKKMVLVK